MKVGRKYIRLLGLFALFTISCLSLIATGGSGGGGSSGTGNSGSSGGGSYKFADIGAAWTADKSAAVVADTAGNKMVIQSGSVVWIDPTGQNFVVYFGIDGFPTRAVSDSEGYIILYDNWTATTVDIAIVSGGAYTIYRGIPVTLSSDCFHAQNLSLDEPLSSDLSDKQLLALYKLAGWGISIATCTAGIYAAAQTAGFAYSAAAWACKSLLLKIAMEIVDGDYLLLNAAGDTLLAIDLINCANKDATACASVIVNIGEGILEDTVNIQADQATAIAEASTALDDGTYKPFNLIATVPLGAELMAVDYCPNYNKVYVARWDDVAEYVYVVDSSNWTLEKTIDNQLNNHGSIYVSPDGRYIYTTNYYGNESVTRFDKTIDYSKSTAILDEWANDLILNAYGTKLYVLLGQDGRTPIEDTGSRIAVLNTSTFPSGPADEILLPETAYGESEGIVISPDENFIYAVSGCLAQNYVRVLKISLTTKSVVNSKILMTGVTASTHGIDISPDGSVLAVTIKSGSVQFINTSDLSLINTVNVGNQPEGVVISPDGKYAVVCNKADNSLSVINLSTFIVIQTITGVGGSPVELEFDDSGNYLFVVDQNPGSLFVFEN